MKVADFSATFKRIDCRYASISFGVCMGWPLCRTSRPLCLLGGAPPVAFDIHLKDGFMMNEPVDGSQGHGGIGEDCVPLAEGLVGGDEHGSSLVSCADKLEQHAGLGLILGDIGDVVEDQ